ncbi:MAG: hypothetical protein QOI91_1280 [Solirubrobacteraceae bacterium]|jgi:hypothetical protein|nr:hypothetical protein [Solirubrobacteraceae bacterium]
MDSAEAEALLASDPEALWAMMLALGARNGVEDLHASGAFEDEDAPLLNGALRRHLYGALVALTYSTNTRHPHRRWFEDFLLDVAGAAPEGDGPEQALPPLRGACVLAVQEFAEAIRLGHTARVALARSAVNGMEDHYRVMAGTSGVGADPSALGFVIAAIPGYWERPELSLEVASRVRNT